MRETRGKTDIDHKITPKSGSLFALY